MMLQGTEYGFVIVPTIALSEDHQETFQKIGVSSTFIKGYSTKQDYDRALRLSTPEVHQPKVIILTPETLFGTPTTRGVLDQLDGERLRFIAIDEVHLVLEWATFRQAFNRIQLLKEMFPCPILTLTATIKPDSLQTVIGSLLRNPPGKNVYSMLIRRLVIN